jgi:SprT-like family
MFKKAFAIVVFVCAFPSILSCSTESLVAEAAVSGTDVSHDKKLQAETDALLPLFDSMPPVPIYLKDAPVLQTGTNVETGMAYTHCYNQEFPFILVKKTFYQKANRKQLINALKHELTHAWLCRRRIMSGHDERFRQKFKQVGGIGN